MSQKNGNKSFDLAVLIDSTNQFNKILCGPILYELKPHHLHFVSAKKYVTGDINVVNKASNFVQEIDTETYVKGFIRNSCDITNSFKNIKTIRLFKFKNEQIWTDHLSQQKHTHTDILIIVDDKNHPTYVLHNTDIDFINQSIKYKSCKKYQKNDVQTLDLYATKIKTFVLHKKWKIPLTKEADKVFKNAICYNFSDEEGKNSFFNQEYGVALITNNENQIEMLLSGITYNYNDNTIIFNSIIPYKNGFCNKLKQFGEQIKSLSISEYKLTNTNVPYKFQKDFIKNKCMLFNINDIDGWLEFISMQTTSIYDIGVITNNDEYQAYFLNKTSINWMEKMISFGAVEKFTPKHHGLITKFAKLVKKTNLKDFIISDFDDKCINEIYFYQWDLHKESPENSESEQEEENKANVNMEPMIKQKSVDAVNIKKRKRKKKREKLDKKSRKTRSEMPYANGNHKYVTKKDKYKRNGKTRSEIKPKKKVYSKKQSKKDRKDKKKKERHRRKDSVIRPSVARKISIINVHTKAKHNKIDGSELSIIDSETSVPPENKQIHKNSEKKNCVSEQKTGNVQVNEEQILKQKPKILSVNNAVVKEQKSETVTDKKEQILKQKPKVVNNTVVKEEKEKEKECKKVVQEPEKVSKEVSVWDLYVERFGVDPKNTYQLQNFTKTNDNIKSLSYKEVRQIFAERAK